MNKKYIKYLDYVDSPDSCVIIPEIGISAMLSSGDCSFSHSHNYFEFSYVLGGSATHVLNGKNKPFRLGDCALLRANCDEHSYVNGNENHVRRDIVITKELFKNLCDLFPPLYKQIYSSSFNETIKLTTEEMLFLENKLYLFSSESDFIKKKNIASFVVIYLLNMYYEKNNLDPSYFNKQADPIISDIMESFNRTDILQQKISEIISPIGYTHSYVCKYFKAHTGKTLTECFNESKLKHATYYLVSSTYSIAQICHIVGIDSLSYFNRLFKKRFGVSPSEYRKKQRNKEVTTDTAPKT